MPEYALGRSTWTANGTRYWDKLWCSGTLRQGKVFRLIFDQKSKTTWSIYRLVNTTVADLHSGGAASRTIGDQLIRAARGVAESLGRSPGLAPNQRLLRYAVEQCGLSTPALARCTLWLLYEEDLIDADFNPGHKRFWIRISTFARLISLDPVAWDTRTEGSFYSAPFEIICSDANLARLPYAVDVDPRSGKPAPPCP